MRLSDIPQYRDVIDRFADILVTQDRELLTAMEPHRDQPATTNGLFVGLCEVNDIVIGELVQVPVYLDQDRFTASHPLDVEAVPLATLVTIRDETEPRILINQKTYTSYLEDDFLGAADAAIATALSHYCLATMEPLTLDEAVPDTEPTTPEPLTQTQAFTIIKRRLVGETSDDEEYTFKVCCFAATFTGITPIIGLMTIHAHRSYLLDIRLGFAKMAELLVDYDWHADDNIQIRYTDLNIKLYGPEQLVELTRQMRVADPDA